MIAELPPYKSRLRNMSASEKLTMNCERGSVRLSRGDIKIANTKSPTNPVSIDVRGNVDAAHRKQIVPIAMTDTFKATSDAELDIKWSWDRVAGIAALSYFYN